MKPRVFIGSSTEGEAVAREVQKSVAQVCTPVLWKFGDTFRLGRSFLESLEDELKKSEYGIFVLTPDDVSVKRGMTQLVARDNVLFELGLFMGRLGRQRTFAVCDSKVGRPSDLDGIHVATYDSAQPLDVAISITCTDLIKAMHSSPRLSGAARIPDQILSDEDALCAAVARWSPTGKRIVVARRTTEWFWRMFPACLGWRLEGIPVTVLAEDISGNPSERRREEARRKLIAALGVDFKEVTTLSLAGFFREGNYPDESIAIEVNELGGTNQPLGVRYIGTIHALAVDSILSTLPATPRTDGTSQRPKLVDLAIDEVCERLRSVTQYSSPGVKIEPTDVDPKELYLMSSYARAYKFAQVEQLAQRYYTLGKELFTSLAVELASGERSIVTPPVVESHDGKAMVIEGTTRATYAFKKDQPRMRCIRVDGVKVDLPAEPVPIQEVSISERTLDPKEKAPTWTYERFRHIERTIHPY